LLGAPLRWARPSRLRDPLPAAQGKLADGLSALQLHTVGDLLEHLPRDRREARSVAQLRAGEQATVAVEVRAIVGRAVRRRGMRGLVEATVFDDSGSMRATFFNQPWLVDRYPAGTSLMLHGKADGRGRFRVSHHAVASQQPAGGEGHAGSVAHYPAAEGVSSTQILTLVRGLRERLGDVLDPLPGRIRAAERLPGRGQALAAIHFPAADRRSTPHSGHAEGSPIGQQAVAGLQRLAFDELLLCQLAFFTRRGLRERELCSPALSEPASLTERWLSRSLPFAPTADQRTAIAEIGADLARSTPMQRLLMGEVGSGKTVVALWALLRAVEHGRQGALMAPTETLAQQHFATIQALLGSETVALALLSGSTPAARRADTLAKLASGELALAIGTHALIEPDVRFRDLAVAVVDEQHRFGVRQRTALERGGEGGLHPHVLHMTATPIPRTLAVARHGDLDCSVLRELPRGRRPIATRIVSGEQGRAEAYAQLIEQLRQGRQAYVVCPLVQEAETDSAAGAAVQSAQGGVGAGTATPAAAAAPDPGEARAATAEHERLRAGELAGWRLELLHGQMRPREKQQAMERFAAGHADVLVATTVIEVGVDVPNATVMLIENAERFGISQLHQLRGRVGRGKHASTCLLAGPPGSARLRALSEHSDGFRLAEIDLRLRREGELIGTRQSGQGQFRYATLPDDAELLERARARARAILKEDPALAGPVYGALGQALLDSYGLDALSPLPA